MLPAKLFAGFALAFSIFAGLAWVFASPSADVSAPHLAIGRGVFYAIGPVLVPLFCAVTSLNFACSVLRRRSDSSRAVESHAKPSAFLRCLSALRFPVPSFIRWRPITEMAPVPENPLCVGFLFRCFWEFSVS